MAEQFYTILTATGKAKIANANALGTKLNITKLQVGDGGGTYYNPTEDQTELKHKVWEGNVNSISVDKENPNWIVIETLLPGDIGGFMIREAGVFDNENNLIAIGKYPETYKPVTSEGSLKDLKIRMILEVSNAANVTLKVDPTVILATQKDLQFLQNKINETNEQVKNIELTAEKVSIKDSSNNFSSKNVEGALDELFTFADNGKKLWVDVIGNPLSKSDSFSTLKNKTNNIKSNFVTKLASKGIYKNYNDNLQSLVDSIDNIKALKTLKGSSGLTSWETYSSGASWTAMKNLTFNITTGFQPKMILINGEYKGLRYIYPFRLMIYVEQNKYVKVSSYNNVENAVFYYNADHETLIAEITPNSNGFIFKITNESWPANFEYKDAFKIDYTVVGG
ncbi:phage tail protein [Clostridium fallax]|uniref:Phage tail-collar fibre protein n=1 Tax=Clostridium fallax TaxID=1533 RepID=A0A1M4V0T2_9CLOT|nr:phage tail protein [Clostridium fallax]SHE62508.1 Phage tail-collar fibre protein [Clostridium fallax]SQB06605.1 tail fiber protein [Clostridium fallax]